MFENVGEKIKSWAKVVLALGIVLSILAAIALFASSYNMYSGERTSTQILAAVLSIGGIIGSVISGILLYGFGDLIESNREMEKMKRIEFNELMQEKIDALKQK